MEDHGKVIKTPSEHQGKEFLRSIHAEVGFIKENLWINARSLVFALIVGLVVGVVGGLFSRLLGLADLVRNGTSWAAYLLPLAGLPVVWMYRRGGIKTAGGTDLIVAAARGEQPVSRVLAPVIFASTLLTHFFGGSAGREGAALQLGGSLAELVRKGVRIGDEFQDLAIMCGMSAGFSAVFGSQITAAIFALEISCVGMLPLGALFPCVMSSIVAGSVARAMGVRAVTFCISVSTPNVLFYIRVLMLGVACGLLSIVVCYVFSGTQSVLERLFPNPYVRVVCGAAVVVLLGSVLGKTYLGSGQSMVDTAIDGGTSGPLDFALKMIFTALTLGAGLKGGEIVPTFAIGATFGCVMGPLIGLSAPYAAALGMVALFCGATNCPLTALALGFEVFAFSNAGGFLVAVAASFLVSGYGGLYAKQKFAFSKRPDLTGTTTEEEDGVGGCGGKRGMI